jgi:hypothetical protein
VRPPARRAILPDSRCAAALELDGIDVEYVGLLKGTGVEHDEVRFAKIAVHALEYATDIIAVRYIGSVGPNIETAFRRDKRIELGFVAGNGGDPHVLIRETFCQRPAKPGSHSKDDRCFVR